MNPGRMHRYARSCGPLALAMFVAAASICGAAAGGYSHREHPLALLGAAGLPGAWAFNAFAFVLPGLSAAFALWALRAGLPATAGWRARIGTQLALLSALAFAAQGLLPLDPGDPGGRANALHALAWTLWWIAFSAAGALLASGGTSPGLRRAAALAAVAVPALALPPWPGAMAAFAPRLAFLAWLAWVAWAGRDAALSRA